MDDPLNPAAINYRWQAEAHVTEPVIVVNQARIAR